MIICKKCGNDNPLGRVFCNACGGKLELTDITRQVVEGKTPSLGRKATGVATGFVKVLVAAGVLLAALALWPDENILGDAGERSNGRSVENAVSAMAKLPKGSIRKVDLTERAINGYFIGRAEAMKIKSISANLATSTVTIRVSVPFGRAPIKVGPKEIHPFYTMDLTLRSTGIGMPVVQSARCGHMPMFGPLKGVVLGLFTRKFEGSPEIDALKLLTEIKIDADTLSITVKK